ncbi:MAG: NAD-dependent epimerase/dehydratase family protein, partial [Bacteroidota bacterium]
MILLTGAAGFIGSYVAGMLNAAGRDDLILVDDFKRSAKQANLQSKRYQHLVEREQIWDWLNKQKPRLDYVLHLGARTDTAEQDIQLFDHLNLHYSQRMWQYCAQQEVPLIYASSAATYGDGSLGFGDDHALIPSLQPLNPYGWSKQQFDLWALAQTEAPPLWQGLKFF